MDWAAAGDIDRRYVALQLPSSCANMESGKVAASYLFLQITMQISFLWKLKLCNESNIFNYFTIIILM